MPTEIAEFPSESEIPPQQSHDTTFVPSRKSANRVTFEFVRVKVLPEWPEHKAIRRPSSDSEEYWTGSRRPAWLTRVVSMLDALAERIPELTARCVAGIRGQVEGIRAHNVTSRDLAGLFGTCAALAAPWFLAEPLVNLAYPATAPDARSIVLPMADAARTPPPPATSVLDHVPLQRQAASARRPGAVVARPFIGTLSIRSVPSGASVWVDQKPMGATPLVGLQIHAGSHAIRIDHAGFRRWSAAVRVPANTRTEVAAKLDAAPGGAVSHINTGANAVTTSEVRNLDQLSGAQAEHEESRQH